MPNTLDTHFTDDQLTRILDQASIYMCACPAQVAVELMRLRQLFTYQRACLSNTPLLEAVHERIAQATARAHADMEDCLRDVLVMEGWDMETLRMPEGLRARRDAMLDNPGQG